MLSTAFFLVLLFHAMLSCLTTRIVVYQREKGWTTIVYTHILFNGLQNDVTEITFLLETDGKKNSISVLRLLG
ncbi:hypothetical protein EDC96DRAFT_513445 [Choanephora cucurbitarum]|nr:hypothetical protein EDC96DRAFT_513445 [Choanephora cucurbitarum]